VGPAAPGHPSGPRAPLKLTALEILREQRAVDDLCRSDAVLGNEHRRGERTATERDRESETGDDASRSRSAVPHVPSYPAPLLTPSLETAPDSSLSPPWLELSAQQIVAAISGEGVDRVSPAGGITEAFVNRFRIQATRGEQSYIVTELSHITVSPDGTIRSFFDNFRPPTGQAARLERGWAAAAVHPFFE
jgi:hypothetical protein